MWCAQASEMRRGTCIILFVFLGLASVFILNPVRNFHYKSSLPHSEFLVQNYDSSRGRLLWSFGRESIFCL